MGGYSLTLSRQAAPASLRDALRHSSCADQMAWQSERDRAPRPIAQRDQRGIISSTVRIDAPAGEPPGTSSASDRGDGRKKREGRDTIANDLPATLTCDMRHVRTITSATDARQDCAVRGRSVAVPQPPAHDAPRAHLRTDPCSPAGSYRRLRLKRASSEVSPSRYLWCVKQARDTKAKR